MEASPASSGVEAPSGEVYYSKGYAYVQWLNGYLTAYSATREVAFEHEQAVLIVWTRDWCSRNPGAYMLTAAEAFAEAHARPAQPLPIE